MNRKENEPPNHGCNDLSLDYSYGCSSPDSDVPSIFSNDDDRSSQGSPLSSPVKNTRSWDGKNDHVITKPSTSKSNAQVLRGLGLRSQCQPPRTSIRIQQLVNDESCSSEPCRINPRRTSSTSILQSSVVCQTSNRCPPQLTRQCDRTQNFVENLVDTCTEMIEVIWPLSTAHCPKEYLGGKILIGLRTFIQEVLKRSKTSYYTLQVALYYLVLIKPCVPKAFFSKPRTEFTHAQLAMQCGRRMFLAALILASKYLQDRNYSARAWSKISGLKISEINSNEMAFVTAVNWKLHIPEHQFQRWANIVFKYSTSQSASSSKIPTARTTWRDIIPRLTPELDEVDIENFSRMNLMARLSPPPALWDCSSQSDADKTPTPATIKLDKSDFNSPPFSPKIPALPTPVMTPHIAGCHPPAARTWSQGQAMKETMHKIRQETFRNTACDCWPKKEYMVPAKPLARVLSNVSIMSSPESMVSDLSSNSCSSRTSRSSSISSISIPSVGARSFSSQGVNSLANHRSALAGLNGCSHVPTAIGRAEACVVPSDTCDDKTVMDATYALLNMANTDKWTPKEHGHKRARPQSIIEADVPEETRTKLSEFGKLRTDNSTVLVDGRGASSIALSHPKMIRKLIQQNHSQTSVGSQVGARKKPKSCSRGSSWVAASPLVVCLR